MGVVFNLLERKMHAFYFGQGQAGDRGLNHRLVTNQNLWKPLIKCQRSFPFCVPSYAQYTLYNSWMPFGSSISYFSRSCMIR